MPDDVKRCINISCRKSGEVELLREVYAAAKIYHGAFYYGNGRNQGTARKALLDAVDIAARELEDLKE